MATVSIRTVTTVPPGSQAAVTDTGTAAAGLAKFLGAARLGKTDDAAVPVPTTGTVTTPPRGQWTG